MTKLIITQPPYDPNSAPALQERIDTLIAQKNSVSRNEELKRLTLYYNQNISDVYITSWKN